MTLAVVFLVIGIIGKKICDFVGENIRIRRAFQFTEGLSPGINLGNSLDAYGLRTYQRNALPEEFETYWHNPSIQKEWFQGVKAAGFSSVRIPVSWGEHMDHDNQVDENWMDRVQEVVDMALKTGLFVILDTHHEEWLVTDETREKQVTEQLCALWSQIGERFADYGDRLLFEGMNEPRLIGSELEWSEGTPKMRAMVNRLNEAFVETVRSSGGYNEDRYLLLAGYSGSSKPEAFLDVKVPPGDKLMVSIHDYTPYEFTSEEDGTDAFDQGDVQFQEGMKEKTQLLQKKFISQGIPVVLTEFGCKDKDNQKARLEWTKAYTEIMKDAGIPCFWWDEGSDSRLFDRKTGEPEQKELIEILCSR